MKLTRATRYAVTALTHMARAGNGNVIPSHVVARAEGIPERFLLKALKPLVNARLLSSLRGPNGGYRLAKPAAKITLREVVEATDGPIHGDPNLADTGLDGQLKRACDQAAADLRARLDKISIGQLAGV